MHGVESTEIGSLLGRSLIFSLDFLGAWECASQKKGCSPRRESFLSLWFGLGCVVGNFGMQCVLPLGTLERLFVGDP
eukprot:4827995-Amphidinium_carterae.1